MNMNLLVTFIILSIVNVIVQTVKSITTVKSGKGVAAVVNAVAFGLYTVVTVYTMCDLPLALKALVVAVCNLVGVYVVKLIEEKARKDKLWKIECTVKKPDALLLIQSLAVARLPYNYIVLQSDYYIFNIFCQTQKDSAVVKDILTKQYNAKYFVSESKNL